MEPIHTIWRRSRTEKPLDANRGKSRRSRAELENEIARLDALTSELREASKELQRSLDTAASGSIAKSKFLAGMSHELRTPLNAIIGFAEILKNEIFGPIGSGRYREYAEHIHGSGAHLLELVNELLDFAKLDAGKLELSEGVLDVGAFIAACIAMLNPQAAKAGVTVQAASMEEPYRLKADGRRFRQILLNLLSNAVKFTPQGGEVTVFARRGPEGFEIAVADTGIGIAKEDIPRAMERFGQIDSALSRKHAGTGLGLPLTKELVELHGGHFAIESEAGVGTTVTVTFPAFRVLN